MKVVFFIIELVAGKVPEGSAKLEFTGIATSSQNSQPSFKCNEGRSKERVSALPSPSPLHRTLK